MCARARVCVCVCVYVRACEYVFECVCVCSLLKYILQTKEKRGKISPQQSLRQFITLMRFRGDI